MRPKFPSQAEIVYNKHSLNIIFLLIAKMPKAAKSKSGKKSGKAPSSSKLRIIAGQWRSRVFEFAPVKGLRPTPNRVRETVFNWLSHVIEGSICLDLFAGSGALSFEALSRGAKESILVDSSRQVCDCIERELGKFQCCNARVYQQTAELWLESHAGTQSFDIVFLDPPFSLNLISTISRKLTDNNFLNSGAYIYVETGLDAVLDELPLSWQLLKKKSSGEVQYYLFQHHEG